MFIKLGRNMQSKDEIERSLPESPDRGTVLRVQACSTGRRTPARGTARRQVLPRSLRDLRRTQTSTQSRKETHALSLRSNRRK